MSRRPLIATLIAYLLLQSMANGISGLWPVYLAHLGAGPAVIGYFIAASAFALVLGTLVGGGHPTASSAVNNSTCWPACYAA